MNISHLPLQVNKKELCHILTDSRRARLVMPSGKCRYDKLKILFIQSDLLLHLQLSASQYDELRTFSISETQIIFTNLLPSPVLLSI